MHSPRSAAVIILAVLILAFLPHIPLFFLDILNTADGPLHISTANAFYETHSWSNPFPKWLSQTQNGFGSPFFYFYSPSIYLTYSASHNLTGAALESHAVFSLALSLYSLVYFLSLFFLLRSYCRREIAFLFAAIGLFAPYHLFVNLYFRGAIGEYAGIALVPLMLLAVQNIARARRPSTIAWGAAAAAVSYSLVIYTHVLTAIMAIPFIAAFAALETFRFSFSRSEALLRTTYVAGCFGVGACLAAPLLLPGLAFLDEITPGWWWENPRLAPSRHAVWFSQISGGSGADLRFVDPISILWLGCLLVCAYIFLRKVSTDKSHQDVWPFFVLAFAALFLATGQPSVFWTAGGALSTVQFPFRFVHFLELFAIIIVAITTEKAFFRERLQRNITRGGLIACATSIVILCSILRIERNVDEHKHPDRDLWLRTSWQNHEYLPRSLTKSEPTNLVGERIIKSNRAFYEVQPTDARFAATPLEGNRATIAISSAEQATIDVRQFAFPGWVLENVTTRERLEPQVDRDYGTLRYSIGPGDHRFELRRERTSVETIGWAIAAWAAPIGVAFFVATSAALFRRRR